MLCFHQLLGGGHRVPARVLGLLEFPDAGADGGDTVTDLLTAGFRSLRFALHSESMPAPGGHCHRGQSPASRSKTSIAGSFAGFLKALHREAPVDAPVNSSRGVSLRLGHDFDRCLTRIASSDVAGGARRVWEQAAAAPEWADAPVWLHGDLHPANVVVSDGTLSGVIDFGELCAGDPATDLSAAWLLLPAGAAAPFFDAYASADDATIRRARGRAVLRSLHLIASGQNGEQGLPGGKPAWLPAGWATLERVLTSTP